MADDTEPTDSTDSGELPPLNLDDLAASATPVEEDIDFSTPDYKASKEPGTSAADKVRGIFDRKPAAPRRGRPPGSSTLPRIPRRRGQYIETLTQLYTTVGTVVYTFDNVCGQATLESAENCAKAIDELAYTNDSVNRAIYSLTQTSAATAVFVAHMPLLMAIASHHMPIGRIPIPDTAPDDSAAWAPTTAYNGSAT